MEAKVNLFTFFYQLRSYQKIFGFKNELKFKSLLILGFLHFFGIYWSFHYAFPVKWQTVAFAMWMFIISGSGLTCGAHRLWAHRSYKATLPLRIWLMLCFASCGQTSIYDWVRDHRVHHKFSDTEADPHNSNRGFWFSHIGWLLMKKNSQVLEKGKQIDMNDIRQDPVVMFERKYSTPLSIIFCYVLPTFTGILLWDEKWQCAIAWQLIRFLSVLHSELTVNSFAHMYGYKPYNKNIKPAQNFFVAAISFGEGWHNYHHVFPSDFRASETFDLLGFSTMSIRFWAKICLAYDLKEENKLLVDAVLKKNQGPNDREPMLDQL